MRSRSRSDFWKCSTPPKLSCARPARAPRWSEIFIRNSSLIRRCAKRLSKWGEGVRVYGVSHASRESLRRRRIVPVSRHLSRRLPRASRIAPEARAARAVAPCPGLELVEMPYSEECCGFGGTFATKFTMISGAMGEHENRQRRSFRRRVHHFHRSELPAAHRRHVAPQEFARAHDLSRKHPRPNCNRQSRVKRNFARARPVTPDDHRRPGISAQRRQKIRLTSLIARSFAAASISTTARTVAAASDSPIGKRRGNVATKSSGKR